jgi:hypothetical protein
MSYSYIKSVFPNFQKSDRIYNEDLYNNLNTQTSLETSNYKETQVQPKDQVQPQDQTPPQYNIENKKENIGIKNDVELIKPFKDNLSYYNLPLSFEQINYNKENLSKISNIGIEKFENNCSTLECDAYIKHILECEKCKSSMIKQLGLDTDKIVNEEIMEIISYIIFGMFILLLIDSLKSSNK